MIRRNLIRQLTLHEGKYLKPYRDTVGKLTIGVGRNLDDVGITGDESDFLLNNDIDRCLSQLNNQFDWFRLLSTNRQHVLLDMCFNLGLAGLMTFRNTLRFISEKKYDAAAGNMLASKWATQVGKRADRLAYMMKNDVSFEEYKGV